MSKSNTTKPQTSFSMFKRSSGSSAQMKVGIGVDYGTSNSAAATFDGHKVSLVRLEPESMTMPSASYIDKAFVTTIGQAAIDQYISANQGRKVELSAEILGEGRTTTGHVDTESNLPTTANTNLVYGQSFSDGGLPGRLFRGVKRLLGSADKQRIMIFQRPFRLVALITPLLVAIQGSIEQVLPKTKECSDNQASSTEADNDLSKALLQADHACIGHPVNFEGHGEGHNQVALSCLSETYGYAGFKRQRFYPEPIAAAMSYLYTNPQTESEVVLTVDFGGGTLDLCILRQNNGAFDVEAIHGIALGGDKIDQVIYRKLLLPLLGKGERWHRKMDGYDVDTLFPFDDYEDLLINWPVSYMLNQNEYTSPVIDRMQQTDEAAFKFKRLYELITQNYSYQVFQAIRSFKETLSVEQSAVLDIPELDVAVAIERQEFEVMIGKLLHLFEEAVAVTLDKAKLNASDINLVLRTGGSSLIPAVKAILDEQFAGKVVEHDPFTSVAAGLAIADYFDYGKNLANTE